MDAVVRERETKAHPPAGKNAGDEVARAASLGARTTTIRLAESLLFGSNPTSAPAAGSPLDDDPPTAAGRYVPQGEIARGGMGVVHEVWDRTLERRLAMKVQLTAREAGDASTECVARLEREARLTARLHHPSIVPVHEIGRAADDRVYFTMRLIDGRGLDQVVPLVRRGDPEWPLARAVHVLTDVCRAVGHAHSRGVVHRDLKPSNVMVARDGKGYVIDWGLARETNAESDEDLPREAPRKRGARTGDASGSAALRSPTLTTAGSILGTPPFMAPEQAAGSQGVVDERSDIYALGAILYTLLCGHAPYVRDDDTATAHAIARRVLEGPPIAIERENPNAPPALAAVCRRAMARRKEARHVTCEELAADLLRALGTGRAPATVHTIRSRRLKRARSARPLRTDRRRIAALVAVAAAASFLLGLLVHAWLTSDSEARNEIERAGAGEAQATATTYSAPAAPPVIRVRHSSVPTPRERPTPSPVASQASEAGESRDAPAPPSRARVLRLGTDSLWLLAPRLPAVLALSCAGLRSDECASSAPAEKPEASAAGSPLNGERPRPDRGR